RRVAWVPACAGMTSNSWQREWEPEPAARPSTGSGRGRGCVGPRTSLRVGTYARTEPAKGSHRQIARAHLVLLGPEALRVGGVDDAALGHDVQLVGDHLGELHVLLDQEDRDTGITQQADDA